MSQQGTCTPFKQQSHEHFLAGLFELNGTPNVGYFDFFHPNQALLNDVNEALSLQGNVSHQPMKNVHFRLRVSKRKNVVRIFKMFSDKLSQDKKFAALKKTIASFNEAFPKDAVHFTLTQVTGTPHVSWTAAFNSAYVAPKVEADLPWDMPYVSLHMFTEHMFAHYLAGVIDGDAWFNKDGSVGISFHEQDKGIADWICARIGYGAVNKVATKRAYAYTCTDSLGIAYIAWLVKGRLHHPKRVETMDTRVLGRTVRDKRGRRSIHTLMAQYGPPYAILPPFESHWFAGFMQTDCSFQIKMPKGDASRPQGKGIRVEVTADQKDVFVLDMIQAHFGGHRGERYHPTYDSTTGTYESVTQENAVSFVRYLDVYRCLGQKGVEYPLWRRAVLMLVHKMHLNAKGHLDPLVKEQILGIKNDLSVLKHASLGSWEPDTF